MMNSTSFVVGDDLGKGVNLNFSLLSDNEDIPELIRKHQTVLRFPDKLMLLMIFVEKVSENQENNPNKNCISWTHDGKGAVVNNPDDLVSRILPLVFNSRTTFSSFTRKLYRWGFRQRNDKSKKSNPLTPAAKVFANEFFQRDDKKLLAKMRSTTAERMTKKTKATPLLSLVQDHRHLAATEVDLTTWTVAQLQRELVDRILARPSFRECSQQPQVHQVPTILGGVSLSTFNTLFQFDARNTGFLSPGFQSFLAPTPTYETEANLLARVLAFDLEQKQAAVVLKQTQAQILDMTLLQAWAQPLATGHRA